MLDQGADTSITIDFIFIYCHLYWRSAEAGIFAGFCDLYAQGAAGFLSPLLKAKSFAPILLALASQEC